MGASATATFTVAFSDVPLPDGHEVEMSILYSWNVGGEHKINEGFSQEPLSDGRVSFVAPLKFVTRGHHGTARCWLREAGSGFDGAPLHGRNGKKLEVRVTLP
jgi:hypothetical protein